MERKVKYNYDFKLRCVNKFTPGCPVEITPIAKQLGFINLSYSNLETGIDSLKVVFGKLTKGTQKGYWISYYGHDKLKTLYRF